MLHIGITLHLTPARGLILLKLIKISLSYIVAPYTRKGIDTQPYLRYYTVQDVAPYTRKGIDTPLQLLDKFQAFQLHLTPARGLIHSTGFVKRLAAILLHLTPARGLIQ